MAVEFRTRTHNDHARFIIPAAVRKQLSLGDQAQPVYLSIRTPSGKELFNGNITPKSGWEIYGPEISKFVSPGQEVLVEVSKVDTGNGPSENVLAFEIGRTYNRQQDIHAKFGGQAQGGISSPAGRPFLFLFTGESGGQYGYKDGWSNDDVFLYTGEGQIGDMEFVRGNKAIRDHVTDGKDLFLFESLGKGKGYRYLGLFTCVSWEFREGPDLKGQLRQVIVFHLVQPGADPLPPDIETSLSSLTLEQLRQKALASATMAAQTKTQSARRLYYERSACIREYVLKRANGICECCLQPAPFLRPDATPYLEPHHTTRLSDGGPDHPHFVAAICPNCHRHIHHGMSGVAWNKTLQERIERLESKSETA